MLASKRALVFALLAYISTFIAAIVNSAALGYEPSQLVGSPPLDYCIAIIISSTVASIVFTYLYFTHKAPKIKKTAEQGFKFGITLIVVGFVLDMLLFLPLVLSSGNFQQVIASYAQVYVYLVFLGVLFASTGVGYWFEKNPKKVNSKNRPIGRALIFSLKGFITSNVIRTFCYSLNNGTVFG